MASPQSDSHRAARCILNQLLEDFGLRKDEEDGGNVIFEGDLPALASTESKHLLLSLVGALPATANALAAARILELRGGPAQTITTDLRKGHNYIDPNIGMRPTINGQVRSLWCGGSQIPD